MMVRVSTKMRSRTVLANATTTQMPTVFVMKMN